MKESISAKLLQLRVRELVLLDVIHEAGSLGGAASKLHVTQPAVTKALKTLEQAMGTVLVERGPRGKRNTRLTEAGMATRNRFRVASAEIMAGHKAAISPDAAHQLRIGGVGFIATEWLPEVLRELLHEMPQVRVDIVEDSVSELWRLFAEGSIDVLVDTRMGSSGLKVGETEAVSRPVKHFELLPVAPVGHQMFRRRSVSMSALAQQQWVLPAGGVARSIFDGLFRENGLEPPVPPVTAQAEFTRLATAQRLNMLTLVHARALEWHSGAPKMKRLPCDLPTWNGSLFLVARKSSLHLHAVRTFFELGR